ncbi:MAG: hypothetical protein IT452_12190 [Planctomycetia bacterium]|nr:hypothetical protein [Planctomycetia bacterium]
MNRLPASRVAVLALCVIAAAAGVVVFAVGRHPAGPAPERAAAARRLEDLRAHADATSAAACAYADALVDAGRAAEAEEWYLKAVETDPACDRGRTVLARAYAPIHVREAGNDVSKLDALVAWLRRARMEAQALELAEHVAGLSPECPNARRLLGEVRRDPERLEQEFRGFLEKRGASFEAMNAHDRSALRARWLACRDYGIPEDRVVARDAAPRAPFLVLIERSDLDDAELLALALVDCVTAVAEAFAAEFGGAFDTLNMEAEVVTPVYVFETRGRFAAPAGEDSHTARFDRSSGRVTCTKDSATLFMSLFDACTRALIHRAWVRRNPGAPDLGAARTVWLTEGLAHYFASFGRNASGEIVTGEISQVAMPLVKQRTSRGKAIPLRDLLSATILAERRRAIPEDERAGFAAEAWALVYFLRKADDGKRREALRRYFDRELEGRGGVEAAQECLGDLADLEARFLDFWWNQR